ncbi:hypothetical protein OIU34_18815 [Pararhizobium sp. BT-229]|uniref:hypothetical protein n=1 Tax=Pararhizobium sp. BT-229 TaxID=2986923 RepID=UPI0021F78B10|nr:hypothetical protein [Pararhizobium sp. BT-229]MCV9963933.1 hypothetical protein [Pararhizobium sp. BT-229]
MGSETPQVREKYFMTSKGERLLTISIGATLVALTVFLVVGCQTKGNEIPQEIRALAACNEQPNVTVRTYSGSDAEPGRYSGDKFTALDRDKYLVDAVGKCRSDVLKYYAETRAPGAAKD